MTATHIYATTSYLGIVLDSGAAVHGCTVPADVLRLTLLVRGQEVGAGVIRDAVLQDPGVGGSRVTSLTAAPLKFGKFDDFNYIP